MSPSLGFRCLISEPTPALSAPINKEGSSTDHRGSPRSEPPGGRGRQGLGVDGEGAVAIGVTVSQHGGGAHKGVVFILHQAEEGRLEGRLCSQRRAVPHTRVSLPAAGQGRLGCSKAI